MTKEIQIEQDLITKLSVLKYNYRMDIRDRTALAQGREISGLVVYE